MFFTISPQKKLKNPRDPLEKLREIPKYPSPSMSPRQYYSRAAKTAAIKKIATIYADEDSDYDATEPVMNNTDNRSSEMCITSKQIHLIVPSPVSQKAPIKTYQFPFIAEGLETHQETIDRLNAQLKYYREHPFVLKKSRIARFFSYLKKAFK